MLGKDFICCLLLTSEFTELVRVGGVGEVTRDEVGSRSELACRSVLFVVSATYCDRLEFVCLPNLLTNMFMLMYNNFFYF